VLVALAATSLVGARPSAAAPDRMLAATGGCRAVGSSDAPSGGGPDRATVVVDTGSGAVWSACISFSGSISGVEALDRATSVITDLDPVYDQYSGLGKAVCKLRGVGTSPPDCLGKSVNSWWLSLNGQVTGRGASSITIKDGDVEGWRYGTGGTPRAASEGTEAAAAPPPTPTTKPPVTPTTQPPPTPTTKPGGSGSMTGSTKPDGTPVDPTTTRPGETTTTKAGQTTTTAEGETTTTSKGGDEDGDAAAKSASTDGSDSGSSGGGSESAAGAATTGTGSSGGGGSGGSSAPAVLGFLAVIAVIGGGAVLIRRRNAASTPPAPAP
jgi:uncharacterized membrane protein YgcG